VFEEDATSTRVYLVHKGDCGDPLSRQSGWCNLSELSNPETFARFFVSFFNDLTSSGRRLVRAEELVACILGMYRQVFRPSSQEEHIALRERMALERMGL
jgi:hypothetical protein